MSLKYMVKVSSPKNKILLSVALTDYYILSELSLLIPGVNDNMPRLATCDRLSEDLIPGVNGHRVLLITVLGSQIRVKLALVKLYRYFFFTVNCCTFFVLHCFRLN